MTGDDTAIRKTVLVVEDNPGDVRLVELFLREDPEHPFTVLKADSLGAAITLLAGHGVDVVLLDLNLPDSSGLATIASIKAASPLVPVVILTGTADEALAIDALHQGAEDYLVKGEGGGDLLRRTVRYSLERARVGRELRESEARFRAVFENAAIGVVLCDGDGRIVEANRAYRTMLGYGDELIGMSFGEFTHPDDIAANTALIEDLKAGRAEHFHLTKRYLAGNGGIVWGRLTVAALREEGRLAFMIAVVEDITEKKRLEDHMRLAATVFENAGEGLFVTDADVRIIHVNPAFTHLTGYQPAEVLGKSPRILASGRHDADFYRAMWQSLTETGKWQGEIWNRRKSGEMIAEWLNIAAVKDEHGAVTHYIAVFSDITTRKQDEERLSYQANYDPLTKLPNRMLFQERLARALARAQRNNHLVALLFIDLDKFKEVNDTLGHLAGDMLLQLVSERLVSGVRQGDTVARLAGDEFTVILEEISEPHDSALVAHKLVASLAQPYDLQGERAEISASIGVALYPTDAEDARELIKLADAAMYRAKHLGRNNCQFHSETVSTQASERLALEAAFRQAVERREFELHYQPIFSAETGHIVAAEALLRWNHPEIGEIAPARFLPMAEETGLILPVGADALAAACRQLAEWRQAGHSSLRLAVNLSRRQLRQPDLIETIAATLVDTGLPPDALEFEIHETAVMETVNDARTALTGLRALGAGVVIDEFGAGYSSFALLRRLPADRLKIAQSFVRDAPANPGSAEVVAAIAAVARGLRLPMVASGIETPEQLALCLKAGCERVQGFLLARPMPAEGLTTLLAEGRPNMELEKIR